MHRRTYGRLYILGRACTPHPPNTNDLTLPSLLQTHMQIIIIAIIILLPLLLQQHNTHNNEKEGE